LKSAGTNARFVIFAFRDECINTSIGGANALDNGLGADVRTSPQTIGLQPDSRLRWRSPERESRLAPEPALTRSRTMKTDRPEPNAELSQTFEPLRFIFAIGALLLGFIASAHL
jgi:hypothetical protein